MGDLLAEIATDFSGLKKKSWERKVELRGVTHKADDQLGEAWACYVDKIPRLREMMVEEKDLKLLSTMAVKILRLKDKAAAVIKETDWRLKGEVSRVVHRTTYYVDLDAGNDANTGLNATGQEWLTFQKYASVTVRSGGDIAKIRANTSQVITADVDTDEDGAPNNYIEIHGCSSTDDPWSDSSDVIPIADANDNAWQFNMGTDRFWRLYRLDIRQSSDANGAMYANGSSGLILEDCSIHDHDVSARGGIFFSNMTGHFIGCTFYSNGIQSVLLRYSIATFDSCIFNGGAGQTDYGISTNVDSTAYMWNCTFGVTTAHDVASIRADTIGPEARFFARNCLFTDAVEISEVTDVTHGSGPALYSEDHDQVSGAQTAYFWEGTVSRDSGVTIDAQDSWKMLPSSNCGANQALTLRQDFLNWDWQFWLPAAQKTVTVTCRETAAWGTDPTATEFYIEVLYLDHAANATRTAAASAQSLSGVTEVDFTVTFTPVQAGWCFVRAVLKLYEDATDAVSVSAVPTVA